MRTRSLLLALLVVSTGFCSLAAASPLSGWVRSPSQSFTIPAGGLCAFTLQADVVEDDVYTKVLSTFPGGGTRTQVYAGPLVYRFTNVESGASVTCNLSGDGLFMQKKDGSFTWSYAGPVAVAFSGEPLAAGLWVLDGLFVIDYNADNSVRDLRVHEGSEENLCVTLK